MNCKSAEIFLFKLSNRYFQVVHVIKNIREWESRIDEQIER